MEIVTSKGSVTVLDVDRPPYSSDPNGSGEQPEKTAIEPELVAFRAQLLERGILYEAGVDGVYGRSGTFQRIVEGLGREISRWGTELDAEVIHFPPVMSRAAFARTSYLESFPDLVGSVYVFAGGDRSHAELVRSLHRHEAPPDVFGPSEVALCAAACHSLYPLLAHRELAGGRYFEIRGFCFRNEASLDPFRMQSFEQREMVFVGDPAAARAHQQAAVARGMDILQALGLDAEAVVASDPFFGRVGAVLAAEQVSSAMKIELVSAISPDVAPTALVSANYHRDHFGSSFSITATGGTPAHSTCIGFGMERIALALIHTHGLDVGTWPVDVRQQLWP
jgi:seryl-tRNA synthetase